MTAAPPVTSAATPSAAAPRLRVVGIGCDGWAGLPERSRGVLASAERPVSWRCLPTTPQPHPP